MEESEDNLSAEDINNTNSPVVRSKPKKRSLVERELETSLTARVISPISADGCSTSRYGRARRQKNENSESDRAAKILKSSKTEISPKSAVQSPVYKMHASNSPIKLDSQKQEPFESQIENIYSENNSLSRFGSAEKNISPSKRYPKVYIRKDLIQLKDKDKEAEETVVLIKNMFSPVKSANKSNRSSLERSLEKHGKRKLTNKDTQSVVKTLDFDEKDMKKEDDKNKRETGKISKSDIFEIEAKSEYQVGDLAWARMGTYPFWPCIVTREPGSGLFVKTKLFGRTVRNILNVTFFGDNGRRSWIADSMLRPFLGQLEFETTRAHFTLEAKKKDPKLYSAFFISERKMPQWLLSVEEAETLLREPKRLRIDILSSMLMKVRPEKVTPRSEKGKRVTRTDSDVSLSESLYDTLFSEDDTKGNDSDRRNKVKQSLDVSEVVTACLDNMAAKTGITKIQKQSHMDRWLLKAKTKTPEKSQLKSQAVQKTVKTSAKNHKPNVSQKPYRFRNRHKESQSSDSSILNEHIEASTSFDCKSDSASYEGVIMENSKSDLLNESNVTENVSDSSSETNESMKKESGNDNSIFKSPLSETEFKVSNERKSVLNKIKQSIDSDENMPSTSSVDVSGMSTSFEVSRVDAQSSDKEIEESDVNENLSETTDDKISNLNNIDKSGPITSSPKMSITDIEVSTEVLNKKNGHEEDDKSAKEITLGSKPLSNDSMNEREIHVKNIEVTNNDQCILSNHNVSDVNIEEVKGNKSMKIMVDELNKCEVDKKCTSNKNPDDKLDQNINICNGVYEDVSEKHSNFRMDRKIKTKQKPVDTVVTEVNEGKELCKDEQSNVCELNTLSTISKINRSVDIELVSDRSKLNKTESDKEINQKFPKNVTSQNKSNLHENNELKQCIECSNHDKILDKEEKVKKICNERALNPKEYKYSESINGDRTLMSSEIKMKENDLTTSPKYVVCKAKCEESTTIDNLLGKDNLQNDLKPAYNNAAFQKYLELKQDNLIDEHPELSQDEITSYLYKTWQYETKDVIDSNVSDESNKTPAKGTNYKALDKERGRKKLIRKKPADFTKNNIISPPTNKSPVNGYHKEIKPIIISPKNKIIFLPRKNITDSVANNISCDLKFSNTPSIAKIQSPGIENEVSISAAVGSNAAVAETVPDIRNGSSKLPSVTKVENANGNCIPTPKNEKELSMSQNKTLSKNDSNLSGTTAVGRNKELTPTQSKVNVLQNEQEIVDSTRPDSTDSTTYNDANDQPLTHKLDGHAVESKVPASDSITKTPQAAQSVQMSTKNYVSSPTPSIRENIGKSVNEIKPHVVNNMEDTKHFEANLLTSEKNKMKPTEVLNNDSNTKIKERKLKLTLNRTNPVENCLKSSSPLSKTEKPHVKASNHIFQNGNENYDVAFSSNKKNSCQVENYDSKNEIKCVLKTSIARGEDNVKTLNIAIQRNSNDVNQVNKEVECKENIITEKDKECVDNSIEYYKKNSKLAEKENKLKSSLKDESETEHTNIRNSDFVYPSENTTLNTILNSDKQGQTIDLKNTIVSLSLSESMKNYKTGSAKQDSVTDTIKSSCSISFQPDVQNVFLENPEFRKYFELKQDSVIDEHPELSLDEVFQYLYKTWLYEENNKPEKKKTSEVDQTSLVKGVSTLNVDKDKKRKKLIRKRPSDSMDIKKKQPMIINQFFKYNGCQEKFEKSVNKETDLQVMESTSTIESKKSSNVTDCKNYETDVVNIDQKLNSIQTSDTVINSKEVMVQNLNESTDYEPEEDNNEILINKELSNESDNFDSASSSSTDCDSEMTLSLSKRKRKQKITQEKNKKALMEPEFVRYLELRQDSVMDEHPELSHDEVIQFLYKTWLYEEDNKCEKKITDEVDQTSLVKGVSNIYADKRRKKLSRKRPCDISDAKKKPPTIINSFLTQNGCHEYHEKSIHADDPDVSTLNTKSFHENENDKVPELDHDDKSLNEEIINNDKFESEPPSSDSEGEISLSEKKRIWKDKQKPEKNNAEKKKAVMDGEFVRYLELRQDYVMDEHPELTEEEITNYLYKTWLYEENIKSDKKRDDEVDQTSLVKGVDLEPKKPKRKYKIIKEDSQESFKVSEAFAVEPKEKSKRSTARPYYNEEISDIEEELALFEIFRKKKPNKLLGVEQEIDSIQRTQEVDLTHNTEEISNIEDYVYNEMDMVEIYFEQLTTPKPNVFKGLLRERVCEICEKVSNLVKCKTCHGTFHAVCVKNQHKTRTEEKTPSRGRKKKRKYQRRIKNCDGSFVDYDGHSDEKTQDGNSDQNLSIEAEKEPIVADAEDFEAKASAKMREILGDLDNVQYDYESTNVAISWNARPGNCQIVDVKLEMRRPEEVVDASNFKCNDCEKFDTPKCFVCKSPVSPKECAGYRQKCQVAHCYKYYHLECLAHWPQTQFNGGDVRNKSKECFEAMSCPRHVCHTCVSDDPRGCKTRFSGDKLARCVRCPATYHSFTKCLPAGSQILTGSLIICPRHYEHRPGKVPCHVNTGWCFICALGGTLICCEYCPTSFHAECLNIDPPEGGYMCEDCETGRLPLYGEMVWVKLGHYRWWPGIILHPSQIPANIMAVKHTQGEFVVRFFGQYDHYWVNRGRVFPFQEGDTGKISSQKSKIDSAFTLAVEHASRACQILKNAAADDEESHDIASSLLPPHYVKLRVNKPVGSLVSRRVDVEESSLTQCECDPADVEPCGPYSQCLNRMLLTECGPTCRAGERCNNRAFEKRQYPKMAPYRTPHRGWGLRCLEDVKAGQFVIEYVGELLDEAEFQRRMRRKHEVRDENFYFLTLDKERMIDAGPKGNLARFMNHSCEPNCETQKWTVLGDIRVGLFAIDDIPANSELTFNYNLESAGIEKKQCMCGAKRCSGYIGAKPKQSDPQPKKTKIVKKTQRKTKKTDSPQQKRPRGRPSKPKELTEIEKDLLIIKNATNVSEKDVISLKNSSVSSDSEFSERCSVDSKEVRGVKRKRSSQESLTLCLKRVKNGDGDEFRID